MQTARQVVHLFGKAAFHPPVRASALRAAVSSSKPPALSLRRQIATASVFRRHNVSIGLLPSGTGLQIPRRFPCNVSSRRSNSTQSNEPPKPPGPRNGEACTNPNCTQQSAPASSSVTRPPAGNPSDYAPFIRRLIQRSRPAGIEHRPTKDDLLGAASSWWERLRIRLKWFTIRGWRRFNTDDLSAFFSWFVVGNTIWILLGTTTFVAAVIATLNSLSMQEYVARWISDYLTSAAGVTVIFESAIVPKWGASTISFRNVYVSRRPQDAAATKDRRSKTATATPPSPVPLLSSEVPTNAYVNVPRAEPSDNYTMFDLNFDEVEVTLSLRRWLDGKGLVKDAKVKGVRGVMDRRSVWWDRSQNLKPADFRHPTQTGDFELETFQVEDFLITVYQPGGQRPYNVSIFNAKFGPFRKRWLFYDMLSAESMTGQYDNCLFSLHMPQKLGKQHGDSTSSVKRMARFRIDGLPIEHAQYASGFEGVVSWILSGKLDAVLDIKFPQHPDDDDVDIKAIFEEIGRNVATITAGVHPDDASGDHYFDAISQMEDTLCSQSDSLLPGQHRLHRPPLRAPMISLPADKRQVTIDIDLRFRDLKAAVPVFTSDLSVTNNALIRPIVAFINANRTLVPIHAHVSADLSDFDGSWSLFETGLMSSISDQIYSALAHHVSSEAANSKRIRQVSVWSIQRGAEVLLDTLRTMLDPVYGQTQLYNN